MRTSLAARLAGALALTFLLGACFFPPGGGGGGTTTTTSTSSSSTSTSTSTSTTLAAAPDIRHQIVGIPIAYASTENGPSDVTIRVLNDGNAPETVLDISVAPTGDDGFSIVDNTCAAPLAAASSCTFDVRYHGEELGEGTDPTTLPMGTVTIAGSQETLTVVVRGRAEPYDV